MDAAKDSAYSKALRRGRHPRSFNRSDTFQMWSTVKHSSSRVSSVKTGQGLGNIVAKEIEALQSTSPTSEKAARMTLKDVKSTPNLLSPKERRSEKRPAKKKHSTHEDVIKRLQALGSGSAIATTPTTNSNSNSNNSNNNNNNNNVSATMAAMDVDTTKLRQDFSSQKDARVYYGSTAALELFNGDMLMVSVTDGSACVQPLERLKNQPKSSRDKLLFTLINMNELRSANPIRFGDSVWLQISVGTGETSWEQGKCGVLGAKVRKAPDLQTLSLTHAEKGATDVSPEGAPDEVLLNVGYPVPVRAYLPKTRDDSTDSQIDDMQARLRNKTSRMVGRWIVRSAVVRPKGKDDYVNSDDEIYLEQDWFYIGADLEATERSQSAVLRQLPPTKTTKVGEYVVERRAAWKIRLVDSSKGGLGLSLVQQQMERLLFKAKTQLKASEKMRDGQLRHYGPDLNGGQGFPKQLRRHIQHVTDECDVEYFAHQNDRLRQLDVYFQDKMAAMDKTDRKRAPLSPLASSLRFSTSVPNLSSCKDSIGLHAPATESTVPPSTEKICNLCVAYARVGFDLCTHNHEVAHCVALGAPLPTKSNEPSSAEILKVRLSERHMSTSDGALRAVKAAEAAELRERGRIMRLLSEQDDRLVNVIKYTEQRAHLAAIATYSTDNEEDAPSYFSTKRSRVRRRLTSILGDTGPRRKSTLKSTVLADTVRSHEEEDGEDDDDSTGGDDNTDDDDDDDDALSDNDNDDNDDEENGDDDDDDFITEAEIQTLNYINVEKATALYANDEKAMREMLYGFADLAEHRLVPQLRDALAAKHKACLLETSDFLARAAEFVMARRIQVHVMSLIQSVATSNVDDFSSIAPAVEQLLREVDGTIRFIRAYKLNGKATEAM
ncbi:hypothetical protein SPRG_19395 [Saprolegnia parasitica CBS 223.65]|uniref:Uncharacterized protein n=1 Tax=Saprolegnia parasitica (strain CBS 223.65) TaxID=695850 RepID=A0A067D3H4_SAPPC|nr:hypothetical protein SPRG_19395 [Saprolegnia parasitica CBS 223.65]KDO33271.1 hypothetical protein SPRG_19395 [Saprolegnia parasitica CBS 223.65]|eukprot:XP_012196274.1 hypothetical protein SPRG_19395 [Saprolegnia parasitica CBS 223.65]